MKKEIDASEEILRELALEMAKAAMRTADDSSIEDIGDEDDFSSQMISRIKGTVETYANQSELELNVDTITEKDDGPVRPKVRFRSRRLTSRGWDSEESQYGADIIMVLDIETDEKHVQKGLLIQSKVLDSSEGIKKRSERKRLLTQCEKMLLVSPAAYVLGYEPGKITPWSASQVESTEAKNLKNIATWSVDIFFVDFLMCWIGDPLLNATDRESLKQLRTLAAARNAMLLRGRI